MGDSLCCAVWLLDFLHARRSTHRAVSVASLRSSHHCCISRFDFCHHAVWILDATWTLPTDLRRLPFNNALSTAPVLGFTPGNTRIPRRRSIRLHQFLLCAHRLRLPDLHLRFVARVVLPARFRFPAWFNIHALRYRGCDKRLPFLPPPRQVSYLLAIACSLVYLRCSLPGIPHDVRWFFVSRNLFPVHFALWFSIFTRLVCIHRCATCALAIPFSAPFCKFYMDLHCAAYFFSHDLTWPSFCYNTLYRTLRVVSDLFYSPLRRITDSSAVLHELYAFT